MTKAEIKKQYKQQRRRVLSTIRRYTKKGYDVDINVPSIPKKITEASVRRLQKININYIRSKSSAPSVMTGEKLNYYQSRYERQRMKYDNPYQAPPSDYVLSITNFFNIIREYPDRAREIVETRISAYRSMYGEEALGQALSDAFDAGQIVEPKEAYNVGAILDMLNNISHILNMTDKEKEEFQQEMDRYAEYEDFEGLWE